MCAIFTYLWCKMHVSDIFVSVEFVINLLKLSRWDKRQFSTPNCITYVRRGEKYV